MVQSKMRSVAAVGGMVLAGAVLAGCAGGSGRRGAAPSGSSAGQTPVLIVRSFDGTVGYEGREPSTVGFSGDSSNIVTHLTWSSWGPTTAVGHGTLGVNDCKPNCATGTVAQVPVTVELSQVVNRHFTAMTEKNSSLDRSYSYPSNWAASAS